MRGECPTYLLETIRASTDGFRPENEIGRGGFGIVYKVIQWCFAHCNRITIPVQCQSELWSTGPISSMWIGVLVLVVLVWEISV